MGSASNLLRGLDGALAACGRRGARLLAFAIFAGLLLPPLAHALRWFITPNVVGLMTLVLLRIDLAAAFAHLRRPWPLLGLAAFVMLACPLIVWAAVRPLGLDAGIAAGMVIYATGCSVTSGAAFARMIGLDAELTLLGTLLTTLLVPLTAPPVAVALLGINLSLGIGALMARLALVVGLPLALSVLLRRALGPAALAARGPAIDGLVVVVLVLFGIGVMDGLTARALADPAWVAQAIGAAFAVDFGLNLLSTLAFAWMGWRAAASVGLVSGNRNMALYLAVLPAAADPRLGLFFALCQFPLYLSPLLLRPAYGLAARRGYGRSRRSARRG